MKRAKPIAPITPDQIKSEIEKTQTRISALSGRLLDINTKISETPNIPPNRILKTQAKAEKAESVYVSSDVVRLQTFLPDSIVIDGPKISWMETRNEGPDQRYDWTVASLQSRIKQINSALDAAEKSVKKAAGIISRTETLRGFSEFLNHTVPKITGTVALYGGLILGSALSLSYGVLSALKNQDAKELYLVPFSWLAQVAHTIVSYPMETVGAIAAFFAITHLGKLIGDYVKTGKTITASIRNAISSSVKITLTACAALFGFSVLDKLLFPFGEKNILVALAETYQQSFDLVVTAVAVSFGALLLSQIKNVLVPLPPKVSKKSSRQA